MGAKKTVIVAGLTVVSMAGVRVVGYQTARREDRAEIEKARSAEQAAQKSARELSDRLKKAQQQTAVLEGERDKALAGIRAVEPVPAQTLDPTQIPWGSVVVEGDSRLPGSNEDEDREGGFREKGGPLDWRLGPRGFGDIQGVASVLGLEEWRAEELKRAHEEIAKEVMALEAAHAKVSEDAGVITIEISPFPEEGRQLLKRWEEKMQNLLSVPEMEKYKQHNLGRNLLGGMEDTGPGAFQSTTVLQPTTGPFSDRLRWYSMSMDYGRVIPPKGPKHLGGISSGKLSLSLISDKDFRRAFGHLLNR